ncbi:MAG TPA: peptidylprolyl isomerase [Hyphomicrobium sp.]|nr:peptidylprolyl isomerase [Hyphomicrobium sp.]
MRVSHFALALALVGALPAVVPAPARAEDKVIATINGKPITDADLAVADSEIGGDMGSMPDDQKRMSLVEFLIDNQLFAEAAEDSKLDQGAEFESRLAYLKRRALRELYFEKVIKGSVSDADARKLYDEQVQKLKPEEEAQASHILVETEAEAKDIKEKLNNGGDFATLAKEHSKDPGSKDNGGDLGFFTRGQMVPQFEEAVFSMNKGDVSNPVQTQFGWHLIKLADKRTKAPPAFEVVKDRILQSMLLQKASKTAIDLRSKAKIEYVDADIKKSLDERMKALQQAGARAGGAAPAEAQSDTKADEKPAEKTGESK